MSVAEHRYVATAPGGFADLLVAELAALGATQARERGSGAIFGGALEIGYRACLWSRIASRVLLQLTEFNAASAEEFYQRVRAYDWQAHIDPARTIACEFSGTHPGITNSHYGALRFKDGICDSLRDATGSRPDVELSRPAVRLHAHANGAQITLSLDLAGEGLHRRGYRVDAGAAPLRENFAAALLMRARWPEAAARQAEFLDPLCGSGTLVIEAAMIAARRAPALMRDYFGFLGWKGHDPLLWQQLREQAQQAAAVQVASVIRGSDIDQSMLGLAAANAQRAGVSALLQFEHRALASVVPLTSEPGLICTNPPYGERLGTLEQAKGLYQELGRSLRERFAGWDAAILTASPETARELHLRSYRVHEVWNGPIACRLLRVDLGTPGARDAGAARARREQEVSASPGAQMFSNRLQKNLKRLSKLALRAQVQCYRLYDADMPEYAFAIDRYVSAEGGEVHLHLQEYEAPASVDEDGSRRRRREVLSSLPRVLQLPEERIHLRTRRRQSGPEQYRRHGAAAANATAHAFAVEEAGLKFLVNLDDYLDTGLFLDHRLTRERLRAAAHDRRFLNLFCYTGSASVYAAAGAARSSLSIDLSNSYLEWAAANFALNGLDPAQHRLQRADCRQWLQQAAGQQFDLVFLDPPTFSNSKRMQGVLDVQSDHVELIEQCLRVLTLDGLLVFSTNAQRFKLDPSLERRYQVTDVSKQTLPFDFESNPRIHRCFEIRHLPNERRFTTALSGA